MFKGLDLNIVPHPQVDWIGCCLQLRSSSLSVSEHVNWWTPGTSSGLSSNPVSDSNTPVVTKHRTQKLMNLQWTALTLVEPVAQKKCEHFTPFSPILELRLCIFPRCHWHCFIHCTQATEHVSRIYADRYRSVSYLLLDTGKGSGK